MDGLIFMFVLKGCFTVINYVCLKTHVQFEAVSLNKVFLQLFNTICWKHKGAYRIHGCLYPLFSIFAGAASIFDAVVVQSVCFADSEL